MRPLREQVEAALREHDLSVLEGEFTAYCCVLAAEVRALRQELRDAQSVIDQGNAHDVQQQRVQHEAVKMLARIHKLCATAFHDDGRVHIDEIRAALRGEPGP